MPQKSSGRLQESGCLRGRAGRDALVREFPTKPSCTPPPPTPFACGSRAWFQCPPKINNRGQHEEMSQSIHQRQEQRAVIQEAKFRL